MSRKLAQCLWVGLLGFYAVLLWVALNPQVSAAYQLYFIEQRLEVWAGDDGLDYQPGSRVALQQQPRFLSREWGSPRKYGAWHTSKPAAFYFILQEVPAGRQCFLVNAHSPQASAQQAVELVWRANGRVVARQTYQPGPAIRELQWCYAPGVLRQGVNRIDIDVPKTRPRTILSVTGGCLVYSPPISCRQ